MSETLAKFKYEAETLEGEAVKGTVEAASPIAARNQLAVQGLRVVKLQEKKGLQMEISAQRVPLIEILHFSRQMGAFIRAGVPVLEALDNLRRSTSNQRFQRILADVIERVGAGATVADAIAVHGDVFPPYFLPMLRSAELTGRMDNSFDQLYKYLRRDIALTKSVRKALIYPIILLIIAVVVVGIITVFVIPKFAKFFDSFDAELPLPTRMLVAIADFVGSPWGALTGGLLLLSVVGSVLYFRTASGRRVWHGFILKVPAVNTVINFSSTERFTRVLGLLLDTGVSLTDALPAAVSCTNNLVFQEKLAVATDGVLRGEGIARPIEDTQMFPPTMVQMVKVGERTGELSEQLGNVAGFYEEELDYAVEKLTQWFEPLIIVIIGVVVGFVALAMVSAMYGIYGQVNIK